MNDDFGSSRTDRNTYFNQAPLYIIIMRYTLYTVFNHNYISFKIPSYPKSPTQKLSITWVGYVWPHVIFRYWINFLYVSNKEKLH